MHEPHFKFMVPSNVLKTLKLNSPDCEHIGAAHRISYSDHTYVKHTFEQVEPSYH